LRLGAAKLFTAHGLRAWNSAQKHAIEVHLLFSIVLDIFGITDHDLMYSQEAVELPEEIEATSYDDAIQARVCIEHTTGIPRLVFAP
jgi:hypothetical protein